jgi:puromycin-sensitive aminopeptidase
MIRLDAEVRPERYELQLEVDPRRDRFGGHVEIELHVPAGRRALELHSVDLDIGEIAVEDSSGPVAVARVVSKPKRETIVLQLRRALAGGDTRVRIAYTGPLRMDLRGLYLARSGKRRYAATQLEAADARRMFPCCDEPDKKARFRISVTTQARNQIVSNSAIERTVKRGRKKTVHFRETPKLSTYLVALVVGELNCSRARKCGSTPIRVWHVPGKEGLASFALDAAVASLERLERYFGLPYPYDKLDLIAVPDFEFGAMENAGAVTFRESLLLVDPKTITLAEKKRVAEVVAHELAHMWFGDLVTMAWWDDLWLNEAFATWISFTVVDDWKPEWRMWLDFQHHRAAAFALDGLVNTHPIYTDVRSPDEATENFDAITYEKGASVVRMVERWLGAATFRSGVRRYIREHREANARGADLWRALEEASGRPVAPVVQNWIERPGFPLVSVKRAGRGAVELSQQRFFANPRGREAERRATWPIPMVLRARPGRGKTRLVRTLFDSSSQRVDVGDAPRWIYANADEGGFYRPLHDAELLAALGADLSRLSESERMGLVGHQWAGVRGDRAALADCLDLIARLGDEPCAEVLEAAIAPLAWLREQALPRLSQRDQQRFDAWLSRCFGPAFAALGWRGGRRESDADRSRRQALLRITGGIAEDSGVLEEVDGQIRRYLRDRSAVDADLAGPIVELAARSGDKSRYEAYLRAMRRARTPQERVRFEMALGSFRDPALFARTLELVLSDDVPTQDVVPLLGRLLQNPAARDATWAFVRDRWSALEPRISSGLAPRLITALPSLQTDAHRKEVAAFFRAHPVPSAARALKQALEAFSLNRALRARTAPALRRWLARRPT